MNNEHYLRQIARGDALRDGGALPESLVVYQEAILAAPELALGPYKLGTALTRLNRLDEAESSYLQALALRPDYPEANNNLGIILAGRGELGSAEIHYRRALADRPAYIEAMINLGNLLAASSRLEQAIAFLFDCSSSQTLAFEEHWRLAGMILHWGRPYDSAKFMALALQRMKRQQTLSSGELAKAALLFAETGCFDGIRALPDIFDIADRIPDNELQTCLLRLLTFAWTAEENNRLRNIYRRHNDALEQGVDASGGRFDPWDRLAAKEPSIGFLGSLALGNNTAKFLMPVLPHLKGRGFRLRYYSSIEHFPGDPVQQRIMDLIDDVKWVRDLSPREVAGTVFADKCTILIDLDGFSRNSKTEAFVFRPAPVQINWINWPTSLGLTSADYFLGSESMIPPDSGLLAETPIAMRTPYGAYTPMIEAAVNPKPPCIGNGFVTFGNASHPYKLSARLIRLWSEVMLRVPGSRFRMIRQECADDAFCEMLAGEFFRCGIAPNRLEFLDFPSLGLSHLEAYNSIDVYLDSAPYGGATTAADCLWMGVPLICLTGPGLHQRLSYGILVAIGVDELACDSEIQFIECAVRLAADPDRITAYRQSLRKRFETSPLRDPEAVAEEAVRAFHFALDDKGKKVLLGIAGSPVFPRARQQ